MRESLALLVVLWLVPGCGGEGPHAPAEAEGGRATDVAARAAFFATMRAAGKARRAGDLEEAARLLQEARAADPEHEGCLVELARTLRELERREAALVVLEDLRRLRPELPRPHFLTAELLSADPDASDQELERAMALYGRALEIEPNVSGPRLALAAVQRRLGRQTEAEASYRTVLGTNPRSQEALNALGRILIATKRPAEAVSLLVRSLEVGTRAQGRRDVPSEMDTSASFDAGSLDAPLNRAALEALADAARALGGYPESVPDAFRAGGAR